MINWLEIIKQAGFGVFGAGIVFVLVRVIYRAGKYKEIKKQNEELKDHNEDLNEFIEKDQVRESNHEKRMDRINSGELNDIDYSGLLSEYPKENIATQAARSGKD